jgi:hypothetical protein
LHLVENELNPVNDVKFEELLDPHMLIGVRRLENELNPVNCVKFEELLDPHMLIGVRLLAGPKGLCL